MIILQKITATSQNIVMITRSNTTMKQKNNIKRKTKIIEKNENSVIVLGDTIVMHINGCRSAKFM